VHFKVSPFENGGASVPKVGFLETSVRWLNFSPFMHGIFIRLMSVIFFAGGVITAFLIQHDKRPVY
jgi:hypothetical protein